MSFSDYGELYDTARLRLRLDAESLPDATARTLFGSWAREYSASRPATLVFAAQVPGSALLDGSFLEQDFADFPFDGVAEINGVYQEGSNTGLGIAVTGGERPSGPYLITDGISARAFNISPDANFIVRYHTNYAPLLPPSAARLDKFARDHASLLEHGLMVRILKWQMAPPDELMPVQMEYERIYKDTNRPLVRSRTRFPRG